MRARIQTLFGMTVLLAIVGLFGWGFIEAVRAEPAVVGVVATAVLGVAGVVWQQRQTEIGRVREAHRGRMMPVYHELLKLVWEQAGQNREPSEEVVEFMRDLKSRQLVLGAPKDMIQAFNRWEREAKVAQENGDNVALVVAWEDLLRAMRRDLGHDDSDLSQGELMRVFIEDIDEFLPDLATAVVAAETKPTSALGGNVRDPQATEG